MSPLGTGVLSGWRDELAPWSFRAARLFLLILIIIVPFEAVSAAREIATFGSAILLAWHLWLSPDRQLRATPLWLPLVLYAACALFSLAWAVDFDLSVYELKGEVGKGLLIYYTAAHFVQEEEHLAQAWRALVGGALLMAVAGLVMFFYLGGNPLSHALRAGSLHSGYGGFGTYLVLTWPFLLLAPRALEGVFGRLALIALPLGAAAAYLTFSRATWLALLVETGIFLVVRSRRRLAMSLAGAGLVVLLGAGAFLLPGSSHGEKWSQLWRDPTQVGGTAGDLMMLWRHSFKEIADHPFSGIGFGRHSFAKAYPQFRQEHHRLLSHAHNLFLDQALQMGLQGLAALLLILGGLVALCWPGAPPERGDVVGGFLAATAVMALGFCVRNLTDDFFVDDSSLTFFLLAGLAMGGLVWRRRHKWNSIG